MGPKYGRRACGVRGGAFGCVGLAAQPGSSSVQAGAVSSPTGATHAPRNRAQQKATILIAGSRAVEQCNPRGEPRGTDGGLSPPSAGSSQWAQSKLHGSEWSNSALEIAGHFRSIASTGEEPAEQAYTAVGAPGFTPGVRIRGEANRFIDSSSVLLDEGIHLCSVRTMHRILAENTEVRERRNQLRHPHYAAPELLATKPNELWSWDITKLHGPTKWSYFYLYMIIDVFSRYVVGWMIAHRESTALAKKLIAETCAREKIKPARSASMPTAARR